MSECLLVTWESENEAAETCEHFVNYQEVTLLFSSRRLSAVADEIVQQFFVIWKLFQP